MVGLYPKHLNEALQMKSDNKAAKLYAGGTDWMVRHDPCEKLIFLNKLQELKQVTEHENTLTIGSGCTYAELLENTLIPEVLKKAIRGIAAPAIRNLGTIGGNICNASPAGDTLPVLYALEAKLVLASTEEETIVPIEQFILGVRKLSIKDTQILKTIILPKKNFTNEYYQKVGARNSQALSKLSFVGLADIQEGKLVDLKIAFGCVNTASVKVNAIEEKYIGMKVDQIVPQMDSIKAEYDKVIKPIDDQRSTALYRKKICMNLLEDFLRSL